MLIILFFTFKIRLFLYKIGINYLLKNGVYFEHTQRYKNMTIKEGRDFIYENFCNRIGFPTENSETSAENIFVITCN